MSAFTYGELARAAAERRDRGLGDDAAAGAGAGAASGAGSIVGAIVGGIVGPLATIGTSIYSTIAQQDIAKKELKQRQALMNAALEQKQREDEAAAKQAEVDARARAARNAMISDNVKLVVGIGGVIGASALAVWALKKMRENRKRNPARRSRRPLYVG